MIEIDFVTIVPSVFLTEHEIVAVFVFISLPAVVSSTNPFSSTVIYLVLLELHVTETGSVASSGAMT